MIPHINKRFFISSLTLVFELIVFIFFASFTGFKPKQPSFTPEQKVNFNSFDYKPDKSGIASSYKSTFLVCGYIESSQNIFLPDEPNPSTNLPNDSNLASPYFPKIYSGNGIDHMNINLVDLNHSGLKIGDEIGVFDGIYCVGSEVIKKNNMEENNLSIPSSANDTIESNPNGFISGHKITLKAYRSGTVYLLFYQTVNNSQDTFEKGGSMFALIDFLQSTEQSIPEQIEEIGIFPNPFNEYLLIEVNLPHSQKLKCEIINLKGQLVRTLFNGKIEEELNLIWNGKDNNEQMVPSGIYFCRLNQTITRIIYTR